MWEPIRCVHSKYVDRRTGCEQDDPVIEICVRPLRGLFMPLLGIARSTEGVTTSAASDWTYSIRSGKMVR